MLVCHSLWSRAAEKFKTVSSFFSIMFPLGCQNHFESCPVPTAITALPRNGLRRTVVDITELNRCQLINWQLAIGNRQLAIGN
jgi:hypothetical protein